MKKRFIHFLCTLICLSIFPVIAQAADGQFTVGFDAEFPPYGFKENDEYVGFDLDLAQEVANRNNWTLVKQPIDWDSKDMELNSGSIDCIWNGFTMNGRENEYTWSDPYIDNSQVVLVSKDSDINELSDLAGKIVVVQADSSALSALTGDDATDENKALCASFEDLQQVSDYNSAIMNLEAHAVDAICMDMGVANYQLAAHSNTIKKLDDAISTEQYAVGFKKGNTELRDTVQNTLYEMLDDGTIEEIAKKWDLSDSICLSQETRSQYNTDTAVTESKFSLSNLANIGKQLASGMGATLLIFFLTLLFSLPLGFLINFARMSRFTVVRVIARIYISIMRGTPLMLQLLVVFFGPYYLFGIHLSSSYRFYAVIIGFSLNYAAYFSEIYRSGIESIPKGQYEAASVLGYSRVQTFMKIIFPQMVKRVLPAVTNEIITLVKDTSLAFVLAYTEILTLAKQIAAAQANIIPLFAAGVFYYIFNYIVAFIMECIEKKLSYYR